jgi:hypothetical protein
MAIGYNYIDNPNYTWEEENGDGGEIDYLADLVVEGNVGIGTTSPSNTLAIETGAGLAGKGIVLTDGGQTYAQLIDVSSASDSGTLELFYDGTKNIYISAADSNGAYFNSGNVGIGTTSPRERLHVKSTTIYPMLLESSAGQCVFSIQTSVCSTWFTIGTSNGFYLCGYCYGA